MNHKSRNYRQRYRITIWEEQPNRKKSPTTYSELEENYLNNPNLTEEERWYFENYRAINEEQPIISAKGRKITREQIYDPFEEATENWETQQDLLILLFKEALQQLTPQQTQIVDLTLKGLNQTQIAQQLGITQGSISHAWHGSKNFKKGGSRDKYGGICRSIFNYIVKRLTELREYALLDRLGVDYDTRTVRKHRIKELSEKGYPQSRIAKQLGISARAVYYCMKENNYEKGG